MSERRKCGGEKKKDVSVISPVALCIFCSMLAIETLEQGWNMFKRNYRDTRTTFTEEILNGKLHFWCSVDKNITVHRILEYKFQKQFNARILASCWHWGLYFLTLRSIDLQLVELQPTTHWLTVWQTRNSLARTLVKLTVFLRALKR